MEIQFSKRDIAILKVWADNVIHGGHWGNGDVVFPDEQIMLDKISRLEDDKSVKFDKRNLEIIMVWAGTSSDTPEEMILKERLQGYISQGE